MWILIVRSPGGEPSEYTLKPGDSTLGRMAGNDIVILDPSASRYHAKVVYDPESNTVVLHDLQSTNGTFIKRERITGSRKMESDDVFRIGQHLISVTFREDDSLTIQKTYPLNTQLVTRELLLESLDQHAVLLTEVASRLNTVLELDSALQEVSELVKVSMGADRCEVILSDQFAKMAELGLPTSIANQALEKRSAVIVRDAQSNPALGKSASLLRIRAAMCVPIMTGDDVLGLLYIYKTRPETRPFDRRDLQLSIAIGHQAALTIQRMHLLTRVRQEEVMTKVLRRFLSPQAAQFVMEDYLEYGQLPPLSEQHLTVLASDITNSTGLSERVGARRFSRILNRYYQDMTEVVFEHSGMLNKFLGDGIMAVFGMEGQHTNPEESAIITGLQMLEQLDKINRELDEDIEIGIGINSGPAVAGYMGTDEYVEFTILGYPVNIAWGLEGLARPNRLFIGHPTYQAIAGQFDVEELGLLSLKDEGEPIFAYAVRGMG